ncbi:MAG: MATE family efflux transporter [Bacteroidales bacterium]|nr:MATE family efflux transporter [Bacteroidales bacterium]
MADIAIAGRIGGDVMIGAVAIGTTIFNFIYMNCAFLRMGTTGLTAQAYGAGNKEEARKLLMRALTVAFAIAAVMLLLKVPIENVSVRLMGGTQDVMELVSRYTSVRLYALAAALPLFSFNGWFIGMQDSKTPLYISIFTNVINIIFSLFFTMKMGMGIEGIALGTVVSQYASVALAYIIYKRRYSEGTSLELQKLNDPSMLMFFKVNRDVFLRNFCMATTYTVFTQVAAGISDIALATNALLMQLFTLYSYMFDGVAFAAESLSGRFIGERSIDRFRKSCKTLFVWALFVSISYVAIYLIWWKDILVLFEPSEDVLRYASDYVYYIIAVPLIGFAPFIMDGIMFGSTCVKPLRNSVFGATIAYIISLVVLVPILSNTGLWIAFLVFMSMRGLLLIPAMIELYRDPLKDII